MFCAIKFSSKQGNNRSNRAERVEISSVWLDPFLDSIQANRSQRSEDHDQLWSSFKSNLLLQTN